MKIVGLFGIGAAALLTFAMITMAGWDIPPVDAQQTGFRGTGMVVIKDREDNAAVQKANMRPDLVSEITEEGLQGPRASDVFENVPVLGHLSESQFNRLQDQITAWVSPDQGCAFCHDEDNLASAELYTHQVSQRMLQMTMALNEDWEAHVGESGVTCYTCHRGNNIPEHIWFKDDGPKGARGMAASRQGQNVAAASASWTSLNTDPFTPLLEMAEEIQIGNYTALPSDPILSTQQTERTYSLMNHIASSLGVNCTHCHNTRDFQTWQQSPIAANASLGLQMVREINNDYLAPLRDILPAERLGKQGDVPKVNCMTCHQGVAKPLADAGWRAEFPGLMSIAPPPQPAAAEAEPMPAPATESGTGDAAPAETDTATDDAAPAEDSSGATGEDAAPAEAPPETDSTGSGETGSDTTAN